MKGKAVSRDVRAQLGYLWTYPANVDDDNGLGGGITRAELIAATPPAALAD